MEFKGRVELKARGYYSLKVLDSEGNEVDKGLTAPTNNVITRLGKLGITYDSSLAQSSPADVAGALYCSVGTGTIERTETATALDNEYAVSRVSVTNSNTFTDNLDGTETYTRECTGTFPLGAIVGTISEAGLFQQTTGANLFAGQLLKDGVGNPTTITIQADEQLIVVYTIEFTYPNDSVVAGTGSVTAASTTANWTLRVSGARREGQWKWNRRQSSFSNDNHIIVATAADVKLTGELSQTITFTDNGDGTWTWTVSKSYAPADFSGDISKIYMWCRNDILEYNTNFGMALFELDTPITKTSSDAFDFSISFDLVYI